MQDVTLNSFSSAKRYMHMDLLEQHKMSAWVEYPQTQDAKDPGHNRNG